MNIFSRKMESCLLNLWYFCSARVVASTLDVQVPLFSQVERVSIQFCLPLWRLKNGQEHSIKFQTITYNVLKMRLANLFHVLKPLDIPLFHLKHFHAPENMSFWWVLTGNVIGKPATLSLNMPLDLLSLHRASYA